MATTEHFYTGNGSTTTYAYTFPYYKTSDIKVTWDDVLKTESTHYNVTGTNIVFTSGNIPANNVAIHIYRDTDVDTSKATFAAGSSIRATDLNNNETQLLYAAQEQQSSLIRTANIKDGAVTTAKIKDGTIATADIADNAINAAKIAADAVGSSEIAVNAVTASELADNAVDTAAIATDAVTQPKIATGAVIADGLASNAVTTAKLNNTSVTADKLASNSVITAKIDTGAVTAAKIGTDAVTTAKILDNNITTAKIANDSITADKMADNSVDSEHYVDGSIDSAHIADNAVISSKFGNNVITNAKMADDSVGTAEIQDNAVTTAKIADAELSTLAGMQSGTASLLAGSTALTATIAEINTVVDGKSVQTTISDTDAAYPTSGAVVDYVTAQIAPIGGLEVIATDAAFPNTQPAAGVVISIADAGGLVVNGSGVSTTGRTVGGSTVTINNIASNFNSSTVDAGVAFMVSSTGSSQTYNYHKATLKEADILNLSNDINDFSNRYRVASSAPSSNNDAGDLYFNTGTNKLYTYNGTTSAWDEAQSVGNFYISTFSESFDNSRTAFTVSNAPTYASQLIISINGVIQKPNTGTGQPSEGYTLSGNTVTFSTAPPSGSDYFVVVIGATVNIGTPSDNTVTSAILQNGSVIKAKIGADAIDGTKIEDDAVAAEHLASDAVVTASIVDDAVTADKLANSINTEIAANTAKTTNATHTGEVTGATALTIADDVVDEANLKISNAGSNGQFLSKQSGDTGGLTWADAGDSDKIEEGDTSVEVVDTGSDGKAAFTLDGSEKVRVTAGSINFADGYPFRIGSIAGTNTVGIHIDSNSGVNRIATLDSNPLLIQAGNQSGSDENMMRLVPAGAVELYFDNAKKAETVTGGFTITGVCTATSYAGDGSALTGLDSTKAGGAIYENSNTISTTHTLTANTNGMSAGPVTVNDGITLTIPSGATYTVV